MRAWGTVGRILAFGPFATAAMLLIAAQLPSATASAAPASKVTASQPHRIRAASPSTSIARTTNIARTNGVAARPIVARAGRPGMKHAVYAKNAKHPLAKPRFAGRGGGLQCVPFARNASGIALSGNAWQWWDNAAGQYARGNAPEDGAILSFRSNGSMKFGHVAVVARMVNARQIEIDHANWAGPGGRKGSVTRGAAVVDVSDNNDWTAVRVALGRSGDFGSIYPTNGFIYDRAESGNIAMAARAPAPAPEINAAPRDLRPAGERGGYREVSYANGFVEIAEAPVATRSVARARARKPARIRH